MRAQVVEALHGLGLGDGVVALNCAEHRSGPVVTWSVGAGGWDVQREAIGQPAVQARAWDSCDHRRACTRDFAKFQDVCTLFPRDQLESSPLWQDGFRDTRDIARILIRDGAHVVAWIGVLRKVRSGGFTRRELARLDGMRDWAGGLLRLAARSDPQEYEPAHLLVDASGRVLYAPRGVTPARVPSSQRAALRRALQRLESSEVDLIDARAFSVTRMEGTRGRVYLVEVCEYFAAGATALEIASTLEISVHTVRQHIKSAYRKLGVQSRRDLGLELARS